MLRLPVFGLRLRVLALAGLAVAPALALLLFTAADERQIATAGVYRRAQELAQLASRDEARLIEETRVLLITLAQLPALSGLDSARCDATLAELREQFAHYTVIVLFDAAGDGLCSAPPLVGPMNVADRAHFRGPLTTHAFTVGQYIVGRLSNRASLNMGYPVLDAAGEVRAVVIAGLDLAWLNERAADAALPPDSTLTVFDGRGTVLVHYPDPERWVGQPGPPAELQMIRRQQGTGVGEGTGGDGTPYLYAFAPLWQGAEGDEAYISIGIPRAEAFAAPNRRLAINLGGWLLAACLAVLAAAVGGRRWLVAPVQVLLQAAERLRAGDLSARTQLTPGQDELNQLASAFDEMAATIEQRDTQLREANTTLERRVAERTAELDQANTHLVAELAERKRTEEALRQSREMEARLEGVTLAAREMAHLLNNALAMPVAAIELLQQQATVPAHLHRLVDQAATSLTDAKLCIRQFQQVVRIETKDTIVGPTLDLARSVQPDSPQTDAAGAGRPASEELRS
jgi:C4-dicarboxylate-specific signal transduction histidine kinase